MVFPGSFRCSDCWAAFRSGSRSGARAAEGGGGPRGGHGDGGGAGSWRRAGGC